MISVTIPREVPLIDNVFFALFRVAVFLVAGQRFPVARTRSGRAQLGAERPDHPRRWFPGPPGQGLFFFPGFTEFYRVLPSFTEFSLRLS